MKRSRKSSKAPTLVWAALALLAIGGVYLVVKSRSAKQAAAPATKAPAKKPMSPAEAALQFVKDTNAQNKVVVWSKSYCPYCRKAKAALQQFLKDFKVVELDQRDDGDDLQEALGQVTGGRSVPRVFIANQFIGGGDDTAHKAQTGELKQLLQAAGAA